MLKGQTTQQFNSFRQSTMSMPLATISFWLLAKDGTCYAVCHIQCNSAWHIGDVLNVPLDKEPTPNLVGMCVECPEAKFPTHCPGSGQTGWNQSTIGRNSSSTHGTTSSHPPETYSHATSDYSLHTMHSLISATSRDLRAVSLWLTENFSSFR